ncbi:TIGR00730 family Rossman fold protein [soil metagenome]
MSAPAEVPASLRRVTVFCGSNPGTDPAYADAARALGAELVERGIGLVYGGGAVGLMGIVADAVLAAGGEVTGIIPQHLWDKEVGHRGLTELLVVGSMHERKLAMADKADGFVALPGGVGTFEELFEVLTWTQLGIHHKPVGVLDVAGFYTPLLALLDTAVAAGFLRPGHREILQSATTPAAILDQLAAWRPVEIQKWLDLDQR